MKNKEDIERKINKLCLEYSKQIMSARANLSLILINFTREYNMIWNAELNKEGGKT